MCDDIINVASATASAVAQAHSEPPGQYTCPDLAQPDQSAKAADPELFNENRDQPKSS